MFLENSLNINNSDLIKNNFEKQLEYLTENILRYIHNFNFNQESSQTLLDSFNQSIKNAKKLYETGKISIKEINELDSLISSIPFNMIATESKKNFIISYSDFKQYIICKSIQEKYSGR